MNMFIYEMQGSGLMRRKDDTLRGTLLDCARGIADSEGIGSINIRSIARRAGVATGTVYNYFSGKDELLLALTEEYWRQTLSDIRTSITADSFCGQLEEIFYLLRERIDDSAGKLMGSLGNSEEAGLQRMAAMHTALEKALIQRMEHDERIRQDIWNETFTKEGLARFIMMNLTTLLKTRAPDIHFLLEIVKRTVY